MGRFENETVLNEYYNKGRCNDPDKIGYMMQMIRKLKPITWREWKIWYMTHVHDIGYLRKLTLEFWMTIPEKYGISYKEAEVYLADVMFRRTFDGYCKERKALKILQRLISPKLKEAPALWDCRYFIDFYGIGSNGKIIGIQLKPESFLLGHYEEHINIRMRFAAFCRKYNAKAYILYYRQGSDGNTFFANPDLINEIRLQFSVIEKIA